MINVLINSIKDNIINGKQINIACRCGLFEMSKDIIPVEVSCHVDMVTGEHYIKILDSFYKYNGGDDIIIYTDGDCHIDDDMLAFVFTKGEQEIIISL